MGELMDVVRWGGIEIEGGRESRGKEAGGESRGSPDTGKGVLVSTQLLRAEG